MINLSEFSLYFYSQLFSFFTLQCLTLIDNWLFGIYIPALRTNQQMLHFSQQMLRCKHWIPQDTVNGKCSRVVATHAKSVQFEFHAKWTESVTINMVTKATCLSGYYEMCPAPTLQDWVNPKVKRVNPKGLMDRNKKLGSDKPHTHKTRAQLTITRKFFHLKPKWSLSSSFTWSLSLDNRNGDIKTLRNSIKETEEV